MLATPVFLASTGRGVSGGGAGEGRLGLAAISSARTSEARRSLHDALARENDPVHDLREARQDRRHPRRTAHARVDGELVDERQGEELQAGQDGAHEEACDEEPVGHHPAALGAVLAQLGRHERGRGGREREKDDPTELPELQRQSVRRGRHARRVHELDAAGGREEAHVEGDGPGLDGERAGDERL